MRIIECEQGSDEWINCRIGKLTASNAQSIAKNGAGLKTYVTEILAEKYSTAEREKYTNEDLERGKELEETARSLYELQTGNTVKQVGFCELDEYVGASPDGLVGEDGLIEVKCPNDKNHFTNVVTEKIDTKYQWQIQMQLLVTGREWCDFVSFNPNFTKDLLIIRVVKDEKMQERLLVGLESGRKLIKELKAKYLKL